MPVSQESPEPDDSNDNNYEQRRIDKASHKAERDKRWREMRDLALEADRKKDEEYWARERKREMEREKAREEEMRRKNDKSPSSSRPPAPVDGRTSYAKQPPTARSRFSWNPWSRRLARRREAEEKARKKEEWNKKKAEASALYNINERFYGGSKSRKRRSRLTKKNKKSQKKSSLNKKNKTARQFKRKNSQKSRKTRKTK